MSVDVIHLPCPAAHPFLHRRSGIHVLTVNVHTPASGKLGSVIEQQLEDALSLQRPHTVVLTSNAPFRVAIVQRLLDITCATARRVCVAGDFSGVEPWEAIPIHVLSTTKTVCLVDMAAGGSMHGNHVVLYGDLKGLEELCVTADAHVYIAGVMTAGLRHHVTARSLTVNGVATTYLTPWMTHDGTNYYNASYNMSHGTSYNTSHNTTHDTTHDTGYTASLPRAPSLAAKDVSKPTCKDLATKDAMVHPRPRRAVQPLTTPPSSPTA